MELSKEEMGNSTFYQEFIGPSLRSALQGVIAYRGGTATRTLWTEIHSYDELPRAVDPLSGWLQNANEPPWTTTFLRP